MKSNRRSIAIIPAAAFFLLLILFCSMNPSRICAADSAMAFEKSTYTFTVDENNDNADTNILRLSTNGCTLWDIYSSDESILQAYRTDKTDGGFRLIDVYPQQVGTVTVTATDSEGNATKCTVEVVPSTISFSAETMVYDSEGDSFEKAGFQYGSDTKIVKMTSSNTNVIKIKKSGSTDNSEYSFYVTPVSAGSAVVTVTDQYGQTASVNVTVTQKYLDEEKYLPDMNESTTVYPYYYGDVDVMVYSVGGADVYAIIKGKKYTGWIDEDGSDFIYYINRFPNLPAGTEIQVVVQKKLAKVTHTIKVLRKPGKDLFLTAAPVAYTGKPVKPAFTIKNNDFKLKQGRDYTVKYSNNVKIGKGKAVFQFKGNYKGKRTVRFDIGPKGTSLTGLKAGKNSITVKWKKQASQTTGYEVQYDTLKIFEPGPIVGIAKAKTISCEIKDLQPNRKYYVRVRTYKKIGKKKYYSTWSKVKCIKTK